MIKRLLKNKLLYLSRSKYPTKALKSNVDNDNSCLTFEEETAQQIGRLHRKISEISKTVGSIERYTQNKYCLKTSCAIALSHRDNLIAQQKRLHREVSVLENNLKKLPVARQSLYRLMNNPWDPQIQKAVDCEPTDIGMAFKASPIPKVITKIIESYLQEEADHQRGALNAYLPKKKIGR